MYRIVITIGFILALLGSAFGQAWQVPLNTIPYGKGPGQANFGSVTNTGSGTLCLLNTAPPSFGTCSGSLPTLLSGRLFVGNSSNVATSVPLSGDCTLIASGAITCTKTNGSVFTALATSTDAANLSGTVASARIAGSYTGITGTGILAAGATGAGFTVALNSSTITGTLPNANIANPATTVNGQTCTLGSTCTVTAAASSATVGATAIGSGTTTRILFDNAGVLGEYSISGTGNVAMTTSPVFTTPNLGTPSTLVLTNATGTMGTGSVARADGSTFTNGAFNGTVGLTTPSSGVFTSAGVVSSGGTDANVYAQTQSGTDDAILSLVTTGQNNWTFKAQRSTNTLRFRSNSFGDTLWLDSLGTVFIPFHLGINNTAPNTYFEVGAAPSSSYNTGIANINVGSDTSLGLSVTRGGVSNPMGISAGVNQASTYSEIQSYQSNIGLSSLILNRQGGNVGIGTTTPDFAGAAGTYFAVSGQVGGANNPARVGVGGNITGTSNLAGSFNIYNSAIVAADKRIVNIAGSTDGATNSGKWSFTTLNAGTPTVWTTLDHLGVLSHVGSFGIGTSSPSAQFHTTGTVRLAGISGVGTSGCLGNDTSGNISGGNPCSGTGFPSGGVKGDLPYYSAAGTGAATEAPEANAISFGADPTGAATSTAAAVLAYGYSKRVVFPPAPGLTTATYKFSTDVTFPAGTELIIPCGVILAPDSGKFVRNLGVTKAGQCTIVGGVGTTYLGRDVRADWWPSTGSDDALAINAADASTTEGASAGADGTESFIRLSCKAYTAKTSIILHASSTNAQSLIGCGESVTVITCAAAGTFSPGCLVQNGQTAGGGTDLMEFTWRDFGILSETADRNIQCVTLGTTGKAIRAYTKNVINRVRISECRTGIGWYNTRKTDLIDLYISVHGETTAAATVILFDHVDDNEFNGDSDIQGGEFVCAGSSVSGGTGYGVRIKSERAGSNNSALRFHGSVFYYCNKLVYGTWASTGTMGDHWFTGGVQCESCGNIADYGGSTGSKKAAMLRFDDVYVTGSPNGQAYFRFSGGNADEVVDILVHGVRIRSGGGCATCRFANFEFATMANVSGNQLASFEGTGGNPNELINLATARKITISNNTVDADGISGSVPNLVTAGSSSSDVSIIGNNARLGVTATYNASSVTNSCTAGNLPSSTTGC